MRRVVSKLTAVSAGPWLPVDGDALPPVIGMGVVISGTGTYTIEHTFDDVFNPAVTPVAFPHAVLVGQVANKDGSYSFPVAAIRLNVSAVAGSVTLTLLQGLKG